LIALRTARGPHAPVLAARATGGRALEIGRGELSQSGKPHGFWNTGDGQSHSAHRAMVRSNPLYPLSYRRAVVMLAVRAVTIRCAGLTVISARR
jgi:hypothetical protein